MEMIFMTYTCVFMILRCVSGVSKGWVYQFTQEKCKVENMKKKTLDVASTPLDVASTRF